MRSLWDVSNLFICLILLRLFNTVTSIVYVENGTSLTLNPNIQGKPEDIEDILWTYNGNKVAERDLTEFQDYGQFRRRSEIEISTGQLTVHNTSGHDSGVYTSIIQIKGKLEYSDHEVQVIDAVLEPNVTCTLNNISESRTLFCSVSSQFIVSYEWTGPGSAGQSGRELHISRAEEPDSVYTCTVKNEVSRKSSSFTLKHCDTDEPPSDHIIILLIALSVIAALIVGIVAAVAICLIRQRKDTGEYDIEWLQQKNLTIKSDLPETQELNESKQRRTGSENKEQEMTGAENMNKELCAKLLDAQESRESETDVDNNEGN